MKPSTPVVNKHSEVSWYQAIELSKDKFSGTHLDFSQEQIFATQLLMNNDYLFNVAKTNPTSLRLAMYNVAAVGLSLNPNQGLAFLIPRRLSKNDAPKVMLDISYRGLIAIGVDTGAILCAKAELVCNKDAHFSYKGAFEKPEHNFDPFLSLHDRGLVRGAYCIAELPNGGVLVEAMSKTDMDKIKNTSEAFRKGVGPWLEWEDQMQLKSVVKRASKWWPNSSQRMAKALQLLNEEGGEGLASLVNNARLSERSVSHKTARVINCPSSAIQSTVKQWIERAVQQQAFQACRELMENRLKNPDELLFALGELDKAERASLSDRNTHQAANSA